MSEYPSKVRLRYLLGAAFLLPTMPAWASETEAWGAAAAEASAAYGEYEGGEIIVTARRRDESAQDMPIALPVVSASALEATGNYSLTQIQQIVPRL